MTGQGAADVGNGTGTEHTTHAQSDSCHTATNNGECADDGTRAPRPDAATVGGEQAPTDTDGSEGAQDAATLSTEPVHGEESAREPRRRVLVLNQFALPRTESGGTRHVELFGRLRSWDWLIIAGNRNNYSRQVYHHRSPGLVTVPTTGYSANGPTRIINWLSYTLAAFLRGLFVRGGVDVVYGSSPHLLTPLAAYLLAKWHRAAFVLEVRDPWPRSLVELGFCREGSLIHRALQMMEAFYYRRAYRVVCVTEGWGDYLRSRGTPDHKLVFIANGAEPDDFAPTLDRAEARRRLGLPIDGFVAVYAGAMGPSNGVEAILDAAREVPRVEFVLIGQGLDRASLEARAQREDLHNVHFRPPVPKSELRDVFVAADVGVHCLADSPAVKEGMSSNKLFDYMAAALPSVSNVDGEVASLLEDNDAGFGAPIDGLPRVLDKISALDESTRTAMGQRGLAFIQRHKSRTVMAERLEHTLDEVYRYLQVHKTPVGPVSRLLARLRRDRRTPSDTPTSGAAR